MARKTVVTFTRNQVVTLKRNEVVTLGGISTGHIDWFMTGFGAVILICFVYTVVISTTGSIPVDMREIFIESRAAVRDIVLAIAAYYWGSSAGSRIKEMKKELSQG